jgi:hypothetical protein
MSVGYLFFRRMALGIDQIDAKSALRTSRNDDFLTY